MFIHARHTIQGLYFKGNALGSIENLTASEFNVTKLIMGIRDRIIKIRMVAIEDDQFFDDGEAIGIIFHESYYIKQRLKRLNRLARKPSNQELQEEVWILDDERSNESRAAWLRTMRLKRKGYGRFTKAGKRLSTEMFVYATLDLVGNRFVYNLTIKSRSKSVITNVTSTMVAYPRDCMRLATDPVKTISRLEADGFVTESFIFHPSKDCVEGKIVAVVSFIDYQDRLHTVQVEPYIIRSVCDLLEPYESSVEEFETTFKTLVGGCEEIELGWNAGVLLEKAETILPAMNFYLVDVENNEVGNQIFGTIRGFALGKYTENRVAVVISIVGEIDEGVSTARVEVFGDDEAMLPTTIGEIADKIDAWVCLRCGSKLNADQVMELEAGGALTCRYCDHALTLDLYCRSDKKPTPKSKGPESVLGSIGMTTEIEAETPPKDAKRGYSKRGFSEADAKAMEGISVLRGCEIVGSRFEYKIKVVNDSDYVITNVAVTIVAFPQDCLEISGASAKILSRIEVDGFRSPGFTFIPTKDCVKGKIIATVTFIDYRDKVHTLHARPYMIKSVCDLLTPLESSPIQFDAILEVLKGTSEEYTLQWNPQVLFKKSEKLLPSKNFHIVDTSESVIDDNYVGKLRGIAEGKYTHQKVAVVVSITGSKDGQTSSVKVESLGDDMAMLPTTIEELGESFDSWICLTCGGALDEEEVIKIKTKHPVECEYCGHTLTLSLYRP